MCTPPLENLSSGTKYSNFLLKFNTSIPLGYLPVCICTGFPSVIHRAYIPQLSIFIPRYKCNYGSTKAVVYYDQHIKRYAIGKFFPPPFFVFISWFCIWTTNTYQDITCTDIFPFAVKRLIFYSILLLILKILPNTNSIIVCILHSVNEKTPRTPKTVC